MKKVMLHLIMPDRVSGPNTANRRIEASRLSEKYIFSFCTQTFLAGGRPNIKLIWELYRQIRREKPDLIHLSGLQSSGFHALVAAKMARVPNILLTIRGFSEDDTKVSSKTKWAFQNVFDPLSIYLCDQFYLVTSESYKKDIITKNGHKNIGVIHNAAPIIPDEIQNRYTRSSNGNKEKFEVIISGRMVEDKGIYVIISAIEEINNENIRFTFLGDGPIYDEIISGKLIIKSQCEIQLKGNVNNVLPYLADSDVFLFATFHENLSNALLEAMAVGLPIIATDVGGNKEIFDGNGFLIKSGSVFEIVDKITKLYSDRNQLKVFSNKSLQIITEKFSQDVIYGQLDNVYERMLGEKNEK